MGKRIRHLEYYGYADQNVYVGLPNVDLSDIREVNKEQDKEINAISGATSGKADLSTVNELSGKVDTFIDKQDLINKWLAKGINKNKERIENLEARDVEIVDKINEVADKIDPIYAEIDDLSNSINEVDERLTEHLSETSTFEEETNERLDALESGIANKIDKTEADETFAKKDDVYTKEEVDELIGHGGDDYATKQWVLDQGYITGNEANDKYASKQRLNALEDRVTDVQTTLYNQYNELNSDLTQFKATTNNKLNALDTKVTTLETKHDMEISALQNEVDDISSDVSNNTNAINQINNVALPNKADKSDLTALSSRVTTLSNSLDNKVDKAVYESDKARFGVQLDSLDNRKADRSELRAVSGNIADLSSDLEQERRERIEGDSALGVRIDGVNDRIDEIREENIGRDQNISNLRRDLDREINDRVEGDNAIIGSPSDRESDNTIYGAKKYADKVSTNALNDAKSYVDIKTSSIIDYVDETKADLERQVTAKADKAYVNAIKGEIEASVDSKVAEEKNRAQSVESGLENAIRQETLRATNRENIISTALTHTSNVVHALTDWDGDDRADYSDSGNGIVDVMHREIHDIKEAISAITQIGEGIITTNEHEVGFGTYNVSSTGPFDKDKTMFSIGIGTSDIERKNGIEVRRSGDVYMWVEGEYLKINDLLAMLAHETY